MMDFDDVLDTYHDSLDEAGAEVDSWLEDVVAYARNEAEIETGLSHMRDHFLSRRYAVFNGNPKRFWKMVLAYSESMLGREESWLCVKRLAEFMLLRKSGPSS